VPKLHHRISPETVCGPLSASRLNADREMLRLPDSAIGAPIGGLGSGYSVLGRHGFLRVHFDSTPDSFPELYPRHPEHYWQYRDNPAFGADFNFLVTVDDQPYLLSENVPDNFAAGGFRPVEKVETDVCLPKSFHRYRGIPGLDCRLSAYAPLLFGDIDESAVPAQLFDFTFVNRSAGLRVVRLQLRHCRVLFDVGGWGVPIDGHGETAFGIDGGVFAPEGPWTELTLPPGGEGRVRAAIAWYYPTFKTPSQCATAIYRRRYAGRFDGAAAVGDYALAQADRWSAAIDAQTRAIDFPGCIARMAFGSLASLITGTMLGEREYFEIETPHSWVNTMDVSAYSSWCVMLLYPELEQLDIRQYCRAIEREGTKAGFVWHSLWNDACEYAEEPTFLVRYCRDFFFYRDRVGAEADWELLSLVVKRTLAQCDADGLCFSRCGNQSYDAWKMPGVSAYVNSAWIYALHGYAMMAKRLGKAPVVDGVDCEALAGRAAVAFRRRLWNESSGCFDCFQTDQACENHPDCVFSDQLFGRWMLAVVELERDPVPAALLESALDKIYANNRVATASGFRGWANGMLPDGAPEMVRYAADTGFGAVNYFANTFWFGPQYNLAALFSCFRRDAEAADIWGAIERSIDGNHLAAGEWNRSYDADKQIGTLALAPSKDTPRFPPYPRYKGCWEALIRAAGITLDWDFLYLRPGREFDIDWRNARIGGVRLDLTVRRGWRDIRLDGEPVPEVRLPRNPPPERGFRVEFL